MSRGVMASSQSYTAFSTSTLIRRRCCFKPHTPRISQCSLKSSKLNLRCNSTGGNDCKTSDAFLLGKAAGEVLVERVESGVGEIRAFFAKLQTDPLKFLLQFEEEVLARAARDKAAAALETASSTVNEAAHEAQELIEQAAQGLITEAGSAVELATEVISEAASTVEHATQLVSEATSTVEQATQEAHELISEASSTVKDVTQGVISDAAITVEQATQEASSTVKDVTQGVVSEAAKTVEQATSQAQGLISEAASTAKAATDEAKGILSEAASTVSDVSKTISSVTDSVSSLFNPKKFL